MRISEIFDSEKEIYPTVSVTFVLLFCGYIFIWYVDLTGRSDLFAKIRIEFLYGGMLSCLALFVIEKNKIDNPLIIYVSVLYFFAAIQVPLSYDFQTSIVVFIDRFVKFSFIAWFIGAFVRSPNALRMFLAAFFAACMKLGQEGFIGVINGSLIWENQGIMRLHGASPKYGHPNSFSGMALGTVPFIITLFPIVSKKIKVVLIIALIFALNIILFTGSRTGYVAFVFLLAAFVWKGRHRLKILVSLVFIFLIAVNYIPNQYKGRFDSIFTGKDKEGHSTQLRKQILRDAIHIFIEHPFGIGVGAFPAVRKQTFSREQDTHNLYLEVATNLGIQGLIAFIAFLYAMMKLLAIIHNRASAIIKHLKEKESIRKLSNDEFTLIKDAKLLAATAKAVILFICVRLGLGLFGMDLYEIYWWFALGLSVSLYRMCHYMEARHYSLRNLANEKK